MPKVLVSDRSAWEIVRHEADLAGCGAIDDAGSHLFFIYFGAQVGIWVRVLSRSSGCAGCPWVIAKSGQRIGAGIVSMTA